MTCLWKRGGGLVVVALLVLAPAAAWAQSSVSTGQIYGTARDPDGAVMPGVGIEARNVDTGFARTAVTDTGGFYRIDLLPPGTYDVRADLTGFKSEVKRGVVVNLGSSVAAGFALQVSAIEEEIVVTAESPIVETTNPSISSSVNAESIQNLPLQGRDFSDFAILVPGTSIADGSQQSGRGGLQMGARAIQNSFNIDGTNNQSSFFGEERGGTRPPFTFSQGAVQEFQVIKSPYNLQFTSSGGVINAVTKSGTNSFKGDAWVYYTDDSMRGTDAKDREATTFEQTQFGFAVGGPFVKDKLHYFGSYDGQRYSTPYFAEWPGFPADMTDEFEAITGLDLGTELGEIETTNDADVFLIKLDWQLSGNHLMTFRDNYSTQQGDNLTYNSSDTGQSNNGSEENSFNSVVATLNSVVSDDAFNEAFVQYSLEERPREPNNTTLPETTIYSPRAYFGRQDFLPNWLDEERIQLVDNFSYYLGAHTLKAGINFDFTSYDNSYFRYAFGTYSYDDWDTFFADEPYYFQQAFSDYEGRILFDVDYYSFYVQDDWRAKPNLNITYGVRYDFQDNPTPELANPGYPTTANIPNDTDNFAPRVGFAWDIKGDGKQVLRGGAGFFYDFTPALILSNAMNDNGLRVATIRVYCEDGGCPSYPDIWADQGDLEGPGTPDIKAVDPDFENAETWRVSLGYERQVLTDLSLGVDVMYSEGSSLERSQNQNMVPDGGTTADGLPTYVRFTQYPEFGQVNQYVSDVETEYTAVVLKARKRYSNGWMLDASYTWSDAKDSNSNERATTSYPFDQYDLSSSWGPSDFDTTHKFVLSASYQLPWDFLVSGIYYYRSGYPYSAMDSRDTNHDGESANELALIQLDNGEYYRYSRNSFTQPDYQTLDLRLSKGFRFGRDFALELIFDCFNVLDEANWWTTNDTLVDRYGNVNDYFGELDQVGDPRSYQLGLKFSF